ncbi:MAG: hypothetical protein ABJ327_21120 [Litoreibacter sp.]
MSNKTLVKAKATGPESLPGDDVDIAYDIKDVTYFHLLCEDHGVIRANDVLAETLCLGAAAVKTMSLDATEEVQAVCRKAWRHNPPDCATRTQRVKIQENGGATHQ